MDDVQGQGGDRRKVLLHQKFMTFDSHDIFLTLQVLEQGLEVVGGPVKAITLPSLLKNIRADAPVVIKLDIQGFECRVLRHIDMFNTSLNIPYIFMEWNMLGSAELCPDLQSFIKMMEGHGYIARDATSGDLLPPKCLLMPLANVLWAHKSAPKLWPREIRQDCKMEAVVRMGGRLLKKEEVEALGGFDQFSEGEQWQLEELH